MNLRLRAERDLGKTLEGVWGLPVFLTAPDGTAINECVDGRPLTGQIMFDYVTANPDTGQEFVVYAPVVTLRKSSLSRVPKAGEKWLVQIPDRPDPDAVKKSFVLSPDRPPEGGDSLGIIRLFLQAAK